MKPISWSWITLVIPFTAPAQITIHADAGTRLVDPKATIERLATGHTFLEGPVWLPDGRLLLSDIPKSHWLQWTATDGVAIVRQSAGANGNTLGPDGVLSCQHVDRNVVRHAADGSLVVVVDAHDGKRFNSPNDLVVRYDGSIWFTDPTYGLGKRESEQTGNHVFRFDPKLDATTIVQSDFDQPNGLCFSPDHSRLWIADSGERQRIGAFPVRDDGTLGDAELWIACRSDGMRCDEHGNLYATAPDGVRIYAADGELLATITLPERPANCAFGGADFDELFVTARTSLYRVPLLTTGARTPAVSVTPTDAATERRADDK